MKKCKKCQNIIEYVTYSFDGKGTAQVIGGKIDMTTAENECNYDNFKCPMCGETIPEDYFE